MEHRRLFGTSFLFDGDHDQNPNPVHSEHAYVHMGRTGAADNSSTLRPRESMPIEAKELTSQKRNEYSSSSSTAESFQTNSNQRSNMYRPPSVSMQLSHYQATTPSPAYDPMLHPSTGGSSWVVPPNYANQTSSSSHYSHVNNGASSSVNPTIGDPRTCKRKRMEASEVCERGGTSRNYSLASTSGVPVSTELQSGNPQHGPWEPMGAISRSRGNSLLIHGEGSQRNVRSRPTLDLNLYPPQVPVSSIPSRSIHSTSRGIYQNVSLDLEVDLPILQGPSFSSSHIHSTDRVMDQNDTVDFPGMNSIVTAPEWNYIPVPRAARGRLPASAARGFRCGANQFHGESSGSGNSLEIGGYTHDITPSRTSVVAQNLPGPPTQALRGGRSSYAQRALPANGATSSRSHVGYVPNSEDSSLSISENHSRHTSTISNIGRHRSHRGERSGLPFPRLRSPADEADAHDRFVPEGFTMFDRSALNASRSLLDHHRYMTLDVDNMSYEELLDLGERIGTVSTGLSEDLISKCLIKMTYCSYNQSEDEGKCPICLEEYMNKEVISKLMKCGHDYHEGCIKKWLSMKNSCPICKAPAAKDK